MSTPAHHALTNLLDALDALAADRRHVTFGAVIDAIGARGFGPLIVVLSAFLIFPVGMVPGVPGIVAALLALIGGHMLVRAGRLWLPRRFRETAMSGRLLRASVARARPLAARLRPVLAQRLQFVVSGPVMLRLIALVLIGTAAVVFFLGFIPGLPFVLSFHLLLLGLGLTARDGLVGLIGLAALLPEFLLAWVFFL